MFRGKKYQNSAKQIDKANLYEAQEAFDIICKTASAKFDETHLNKVLMHLQNHIETYCMLLSRVSL